MHYTPHTFVRHCGNESLVWNCRTSGCLVLEDARVFLEALEAGERPFPEIVQEVARRYGCPAEDIREDVGEFLGMLVRQRFCAGEAGELGETLSRGPVPSGASPSSLPEGGREEHPEDWTPLGSFLERHRLPSELHMDLTNGCTERCIHCYIPDYTPRFLTLDLARKILGEFREAGGLTVHFSGGECMMHPDFAQILLFARELGLNMLVLSNLTLCDREKVEVLKKADPQFVNVSLYSMDSRIHDGITSLPGSWNRTMEAILALQEAGVHVRLASPVMKNNRESLEELVRFAQEHHVHLIPDCDIFGQMDHDCSNKSCSLSPGEYEAVLRRHPALFPLSPASAERCCPESKVCDIGQGRIDVNADGDYYPCDGCHGLVLGNAREMTFTQVWEGERLNALRALRNRDFGACASCEHRPWCKVCPARNFNETGDMFRHAPERCVMAAIRHRLHDESRR